MSVARAEKTLKVAKQHSAAGLSAPKVTSSTSIAPTQIDAYIKNLPDWQRTIATRLRALIHESDPAIEEQYKWNFPYFAHSGPVCFFWGSKSFVEFPFWQGSLIKDAYKAFDDEPGNLHNYSIRYTDSKELKDAVILDYVKQAIANNLQEKKVSVKGRTRPTLTMSPEIKATLQKVKLLNTYNARIYYQRNGYLGWIAEGKQEATPEKRIATMLTELREGTYMPAKGIATWGMK